LGDEDPTTPCTIPRHILPSIILAVGHISRRGVRAKACRHTIGKHIQLYSRLQAPYQRRLLKPICQCGSG
jgi:hypothetical protein